MHMLLDTSWLIAPWGVREGIFSSWTWVGETISFLYHCKFAGIRHLLFSSCTQIQFTHCWKVSIKFMIRFLFLGAWHYASKSWNQVNHNSKKWSHRLRLVTVWLSRVYDEVVTNRLVLVFTSTLLLPPCLPSWLLLLLQRAGRGINATYKNRGGVAAASLAVLNTTGKNNVNKTLWLARAFVRRYNPGRQRIISRWDNAINYEQHAFAFLCHTRL